MSTSKPTLLLLHGSWHSNQVWERVVPDLEANGYKTISPQVCFCGTDTPVESIAPCIVQIQDIIGAETAAGRDVVLINHSFGGVVGCSAVKGYTRVDSSKVAPGTRGRVIGIVQVCAMTIPSDMDLREFLIGRVGMTPIIVPGPDGWDEFVKDPGEALYQDLDPDDAKLWVSRLLKHSSSTRVKHESIHTGWADVPVYYVLCTKDQTIPPLAQERMAALIRERNPTGVTMKDIESGHSPMLSKPKQTADILLEAANSFQASSML